jgi:hypothetical protein
VAALIVVFGGFASSYYLWPVTQAARYPTGRPMSPSLPRIVHVHALIFSAWVALFVVQAGLVTANRVRQHRQLGAAGGVFVLGMIVTGLLTAVQGARDGWNPGGPYRDALSFMFVGVADLAVFASTTAAALYWRSRPEWHRRLMVLGTVGGLMWPAITRMPTIAGRPPLMFGLLALLVLAPAVRDLLVWSRSRWLTLAVALAILSTFPLRVAVANGAAWRVVAEWVIR